MLVNVWDRPSRKSPLIDSSSIGAIIVNTNRSKAKHNIYSGILNPFQWKWNTVEFYV